MLAAIDNWIFLVFLAVAGLFKLLTKAAGSKSAPDLPDESTFPKPDAERPAARPMSDEEQIRKFLEALGQPRTAKPPPRVPPKIDVAPRPLAPVRPPPTVIPVPIPKRRQAAEAQRRAQTRPEIPPPLPKQIFEPKRDRTPAAALAPVFEVQESARPYSGSEPARQPAVAVTSDALPTSPDQTIDLMKLLRSPGGLRQAIILREIFGTPRSLQSLEDLPGTA